MTFKDYQKNKQVNRDSITNGKESIKLSDLVNQTNTVTITDFAYGIASETGKEYMVCTFSEMPDRFFFASTLLMKDIKAFVNDCFAGSLVLAKESIKAEGGWKYAFSARTTKEGRPFYAWDPITD